MSTVLRMRFEVVTPAAAVVDEDVSKISAEAPTGWFTLLPRHVDFVATLVPGLLSYLTEDGEHLLAVDGGVLVKRGLSVRIATGEAAGGDSVLALQRALRHSFEELAESERRSRAALAHLESDAVRRLIELADRDR